MVGLNVDLLNDLFLNSVLCYFPLRILLVVSVPLATLVQTSLGLYRSPTGPGR